jgi:trigger factor
MNVYQEKIGDLHYKIAIHLTKEDYEPKVKSSLNKLAKHVPLKGFRPGMVPVGLVKKMFGNSVLYEEVQKILDDTVYNYLKENQIEILATPLPDAKQKTDWDIYHLGDIYFDYEIGVAPAFDLSYLERATTFTKYKIIVEEKLISEELESLRKRHPNYIFPEEVGENDILTLYFEELDENGNPKEEGYKTTSYVNFEIVKPEYKQIFLQLKKEESAVINVLDVFDRNKDGIAKFILNLKSEEELNKFCPQFKITLREITRMILPELNEEFFIKAFGKNGPKTEEEARNFIASDIEAYFDGKTDAFLTNDLYKALMQHVDFPLPDQFLKKWILSNKEKPFSQEILEIEYPDFAKRLRWELIINRIVNEQNFEVTDAELEEEVRHDIDEQLYKYGLSGMITFELIDNYAKKQLKDRKYVSKVEERLLERKALKYIKSKVNLVEQPISLEEFNAMIKKENATVE